MREATPGQILSHHKLAPLGHGGTLHFDIVPLRASHWTGADEESSFFTLLAADEKLN